MLKWADVSPCPAVRKFEAWDNFTVDTSEIAKVQICSLGIEFVRYCVVRTEEHVAAAEITAHTLLKDASDAAILAELKRGKFDSPKDDDQVKGKDTAEDNGEPPKEGQD